MDTSGQCAGCGYNVAESAAINAVEHPAVHLEHGATLVRPEHAIGPHQNEVLRVQLVAHGQDDNTPLGAGLLAEATMRDARAQERR